MSANEKDGRGRTEPTLGDLDSLGAPRPPAAPSPAPPARVRRDGGRGGGSPVRWHGWLWPLLALVVIAAGTLAWLDQDHLRDLFPRTQLNSVLARADKALARGDLDGHDGTSARELYEAANAMEPDNDQARQGLRKVAAGELDRAHQAIAAARYDDAQNEIAVARELLGGGQQVDDAQQALDKARNAQPQNHTDVLTERAQQALANGRLDGPDGAAELFRRALASDAGNAVARHGLDKVGDALASRARDDLQKGDLASASSTIDRIGDLLPQDGDLPSLRAGLAQARQQADAALTDHLKQGEDDLRAGRFTGDGDDNALAQFQAVLAVDPDNPRAHAGLGQVAQALVLRANAAIDGGDLDQANQLLDSAEKLAPRSADLAAARSRLDEAQGQAGGDAAVPAAAPLSADQQARLQRLLQRADAATEAGDIMSPPGASAFDLYRAALAIDANDADARQGLKDLPERTAVLFGKALSAGQLARAGDLLSTLRDLAPGDPAQDGLRDRLAAAWLDRAEHAMDSGDAATAQHALAAAQQLDPGSARLQELQARAHGG